MPKEEQGYAKRVFGNLSSTLYFEKTNKPKKTKLLSEGSLNLSFKDVLRLKQKTTLLSVEMVYIQHFTESEIFGTKFKKMSPKCKQRK